MKRKILVLFAVLFAFVLLFAACGEEKQPQTNPNPQNQNGNTEQGGKTDTPTDNPDTPMPDEHKHTVGEWIVDTEPNCTEAGSKHQVCAECGETIKAEAIPATGHTHGEWVTDKEPTCTEVGSKHRTCTICGNVENETISTTRHIEVVDPAVIATCTTEGKTEGSHCSVCKTIIKAQVAIPPSHNYQNLICTVCGNSMVTKNETGKEYYDKNGLSVTLISYVATPKEGYTEYTIQYTIKNVTPDSKLMPGSFKLFFADDTGESQYGFFNYLYYGESITQTYTWKILQNQKVLVLEYNADDPEAGLSGAFFRNKPVSDTFHWFIE
ncbi:MAG: hypothetical protein E7680_00395 [Ruminococcaceae bacterium]|nr:hypothetical protein [Oscillospiraceae bacterium]